MSNNDNSNNEESSQLIKDWLIRQERGIASNTLSAEREMFKRMADKTKQDMVKRYDKVSGQLKYDKRIKANIDGANVRHINTAKKPDEYINYMATPSNEEHLEHSREATRLGVDVDTVEVRKRERKGKKSNQAAKHWKCKRCHNWQEPEYKECGFCLEGFPRSEVEATPAEIEIIKRWQSQDRKEWSGDAVVLGRSVKDVICKHSNLTPVEASVLMLFATATQLTSVCNHYPYLFIKAPDYGAGKTSVLNMLFDMCRRVPTNLRASQTTPAVRCAMTIGTTILRDESDTKVWHSEEIGMFNANFTGSSVEITKKNEQTGVSEPVVSHLGSAVVLCGIDVGAIQQALNSRFINLEVVKEVARAIPSYTQKANRQAAIPLMQDWRALARGVCKEVGIEEYSEMFNSCIERLGKRGVFNREVDVGEAMLVGAILLDRVVKYSEVFNSNETWLGMVVNLLAEQRTQRIEDSSDPLKDVIRDVLEHEVRCTEARSVSYWYQTRYIEPYGFVQEVIVKAKHKNIYVNESDVTRKLNEMGISKRKCRGSAGSTETIRRHHGANAKEYVLNTEKVLEEVGISFEVGVKVSRVTITATTAVGKASTKL